jgi:hypothetical protein
MHLILLALTDYVILLIDYFIKIIDAEARDPIYIIYVDEFPLIQTVKYFEYV